jgi:hypothetical protein
MNIHIERTTKNFFFLDNNTFEATVVEGLSTADPDVWVIPDKGHFMIGHSLFESTKSLREHALILLQVNEDNFQRLRYNYRKMCGKIVMK